MDVFSLRDKLIADYAAYIQSFINIQDEWIKTFVEGELTAGALWPNPLIQLNPAFEPGAWIDDLVKEGILHPQCPVIFRIKPLQEAEKPLRLHKHQPDAIKAAQSGDNYILTTGTGSGKSLAYIIPPIVNHVLRRGSGRGIQAIVVYPMNALANSQAIELEKFLCRGFPKGQPPVTFRRYTGQEGAAQRLSQLTGIPPERCSAAIQTGLLAGYNVADPATHFPVFAFRLHQFISRGDTVYASLETSDQRYITLNGQQFVPGDRNRMLLPLAFCRECGQEYYVVRRTQDEESGHTVFLSRELRDQLAEEDEERGFLYYNPTNPWPEDDQQILELIPEDWLEETKSDLRVKRSHRNKLPKRVRINSMGQEEGTGSIYQFIKSPFAFCLNCGVAYGSRERSDFGKLASLSSEGRSTATTVLSLSALRTLRRDLALEQKAKKLLSFTDNRQDASLQAGHFNDFIEVGLLRAALYRAVNGAGPDGLAHDELAHRVFEALNLPLHLYAADLPYFPVIS